MTQYQIFIQILCLIFYFSIEKALCQEPTAEFSPHITATCKGSTMSIRAEMNMPYTGVIHARDYRTPKCMVYGNGSQAANLTINLVSTPTLPDFCGVFVQSNTNDHHSQERSIQLAVRVHRTLELADDKFYVITCGRAAYSRSSNSQVLLKLIKNERPIREAINGHDYSLRAEILEPKKTNGIRVTNCFAFDKKNSSLPLIDNDGCPIESVISKFKPNSDGKSADAYIRSMFKFPEDSEVHLQCDVSSCEESCFEEPNCKDIAIAGIGGSGTKTPQVKENSDAMLLGATTVYVLDPTEKLVSAEVCSEGGIRPKWLLWLAIAIGVLFLIMLLMNIFLCTAMTCSCARTEIIEKDPSIIEEYDPYRSWHGSQYGSRYSLQARDMANKGYTSGGSTIHSNRSDRF